MKRIFIKPQTIIYEKNDFSSQCIDVALYGMGCSLLKSEGEWSYIDMEYGYKGYVRTDTIDSGAVGSRVVCSEFADVLPSADYYHAPLASLPMGARLEIVAEGENSRFSTVLYNGREAYIRKSQVKPYKVLQKNEALRKELVIQAEKYLNSPYRWGGKTADGIDCSGLTFMAYYLCGYMLYRDAAPEKQRLLKTISIENIGVGDLIYYPGHVTMYIGQGSFIHSTTAFDGTARINSLNPEAVNYSPSHDIKNISEVKTLFHG